MVSRGRILCRCWSAILVVASVAACGGNEINGICPAGSTGLGSTVRIGLVGRESLPDPLGLAEGNSMHLMAFVTERDACGAVVAERSELPVTWLVADAGLAAVYANGVVHALAAGVTQISAIYQSDTATQRLQVVALGAVPSMTSLLAGGAQSCATTADGTLYCWGAGIPHVCEAAGGGFACGTDYTTGVLASQEYPALWATCTYGGPQDWGDFPAIVASDFACSRIPSRYTTGLDFSVVDVGPCGVTDGGALYCAGIFYPPAAVGGGTDFTTVSVGSGYACALDRNGTAFCWGGNDFGLGDGTQDVHDTPQPVYGDHVFTAIETATFTACALDVDGRAYCWGAVPWMVDLYQLETCTSGYLSSPCSLIPRPVGDTVFQLLTVGGAGLLDEHVCGLTADSTAYCWGRNLDGQLGDGTTTASPTPVRVAGGLRFASISAGWSHTCGLTTDGATYCWGSNAAGQLGHPGVTSASAPVPVTGAPTFAEIAAGGEHTCGRTAVGAVFCWGWNEGGQLGNGMLANQGTPTRIAGQQ